LKIGLKILLLLGVVVHVVSCASGQGARQRGPAQLPLSCPYKQAAIQISLKADPELNPYNNAPHTLYICFYQLKDPNAFNLKARYDDGLYELLDCSLFDPSVTSFERVTVEPGKNQALTMDRAEGSNYFAMVAGYFQMEKDRITRFWEIPVDTKTKALTPWKKYLMCNDLILDITLGSQQIERAEVFEK